MQWAISWEAGQPFETGADSIFTHAYTVAGVKIARIHVIDDDGFSSDTIHDTIIVRKGVPVAIPVFRDSVWIFDTVTYTVRGTDPDTNGSVKLRAVSWDTGLPFESQTDTLFRHAYMAEGIKRLRVYVVDDNGISSDTVHASVYVRPGKPVITSFTIDTSAHGGMFVVDTNRYIVAAFDVNGTIRKVYISWNGDEIAEDSIMRTGSAVVDTFAHTWAIGDSGQSTIKYWCVDEDAITSSIAAINCFIRLARPVVDSVWMNVRPDSLYVRNTNTYYIKSHDQNNEIRKIFASWSGGAAAEDSLNNAGATDSVFTFSHRFTIADTGNRTLKFWTRDADGLLSNVKTMPVRVKLGAPHLWGDTADTVWVIVDSGVGRPYCIHINSIDSNGTIGRYYWNEASNDTGEYAKNNLTDTSMRNISIGDLITPFQMYIFALDNDTIPGSGRFVVVADSVPPEPTVTHTPVTGQMKISWSGKDAKDVDSTQYKLVIKKGSVVTETDENDSAYIVFKFTKIGAGIFGNGTPPDDFSYIYTPPSTGKYYYKIISKDARGSINRSVDANFNFYMTFGQSN
jgi:hypothetical protein